MPGPWKDSRRLWPWRAKRENGMLAPLCCCCIASGARNFPSIWYRPHLAMLRMRRRGFKSYKQIVKVYYKMGKTEEMLAAYRFLPDLFAPKILQRSAGSEYPSRKVQEISTNNVNQDCCHWHSVSGSNSSEMSHLWWRRELLAYTQIAVTRNQSEKKLNSLLDTVSNSTDVQLLQVIESTLHSASCIRWLSRVPRLCSRLTWHDTCVTRWKSSLVIKVHSELMHFPNII